MKKVNKKANRIKQQKAQKRSRVTKKNKQRNNEKLSMKKNVVVKKKEAMYEDYLQMISKQFDAGLSK